MDKITNVLMKSLIINSLLSISKIFFGFIGNSSALIADGVHSFSDLATDVVSITGRFLSKKPADREHPFGHGKIEYLTSMIIGLVVICLGFILLYESFDSKIVIPSIFMTLVSLFTIISKYFLANYITKKGYLYENSILIASGKESKADVYSSIVVLISIVLMIISTKIPMLKYANIIATIMVSLLIIKTGFGILKENISVLLGEQITDKKYIKNIKKLILKHESIKEITNLHVLKYGSYYKLLADVKLDASISLNTAHEIIDNIESELKELDEKIVYVFIHMEPL